MLLTCVVTGSSLVPPTFARGRSGGRLALICLGVAGTMHKHKLLKPYNSGQD